MEALKVGAPIIHRGMGYQLWTLVSKKFGFATAQQNRIGDTLLADMKKASAVASHPKKGVVA